MKSNRVDKEAMNMEIPKIHESEAMMHEHGADWTNPCKNLTNTDQYCEL